MYKYEEPNSWNVSEILDQYSQEDIFRIVFGQYPDYSINYLSPFRDDSHPNCYFQWYKGKLLFKDYADRIRDCFQAVKDYAGLDTNSEVFTFIHEYFRDNKLVLKTEFKKAKIEYKEAKSHSITVFKRKFELRDELYWKQYFITENQLTEDLVFPVFRFRYFSSKQSRWLVANPTDITYAITGFKQAKKMYRPMNKNPKSKWLTNCSRNDIGNIGNISTELDYLMITKSYKDHRVIKNEKYSNTVWFQSESQFPDDDILLDLIKSYPYIFIFYDNDKAGIKGSKKLMEKIIELQSFKIVKTMYSPFPIFKDPASIVSNKGRKELQKILWKNCRV